MEKNLTINKFPTLLDFQELVRFKTCRWCDYKISLNVPLEYYDHHGGFDVLGFKEPQWLYVTCPKCKYQWSLWKLGIKQSDAEFLDEEITLL